MKQTRYSKQDYIKSSPHFFRLIGSVAFALALLLFCGAILIPSPLLGPADIGSPPNPAKSAWFLLWIQELVSYGTKLIYPVIAIVTIFVLLPWLPIYRPVWRGSWFPKGQKWVNILTVATVSVIVVLTLIAAFFRGPEWQFVSPF